MGQDLDHGAPPSPGKDLYPFTDAFHQVEVEVKVGLGIELMRLSKEGDLKKLSNILNCVWT